MRKIIGSLVSLLVLMLMISNILLAGLLALTYSNLTKEEVVAIITFDNVPDQSSVYIAHLYDRDESKIDDYSIYGDQWRMDAGFIKVKYWANILGVDSKYTLNRFEGRYKDIKDENNKKHKSYQIESHNLIDIFHFFVDTTYGSSVYQDIKLNTKYIVLKSQIGLMVREQQIPVKQEKSIWEKAKSLIN
ncbi:MAG TPA: hypothetical protein EYG21_07225 [Nitrospinaceae bacterium]|nr:hypothetical protein [Nitrospinaceae bacterium]